MYLDFRVAASLALAVADHTAFLGLFVTSGG